MDHGCGGGLMDYAFEFIQQNHGLATEAKINGHEDVPHNNEKALLKTLANQPISVAIDASGSAFQFYKDGVLKGECGIRLDHGVTVVGYGTNSNNGIKYLLVKNSWGTEWGDKDKNAT
ncbi:hypothetical protein IFM89_023479 [Coptis chinensis]|uniref:Peptidase C1A papain C-terminal domain-containing protein n=1 Tax=Coptis chinensis TaxID=261450 RepID=A0A835HGI8_9MAGN|nr:hypothetical protein IFM89_023479 [Coptis chinensis]